MSCTRRPAGPVLEFRAEVQGQQFYLGQVTSESPVASDTHSSPSGSFQVCVFIKNLINVQITKPLTPQAAGVWGTGGGLSINSVLTFAEIPPGPAGGKGLSVIPA